MDLNRAGICYDVGKVAHVLVGYADRQVVEAVEVEVARDESGAEIVVRLGRIELGTRLAEDDRRTFGRESETGNAVPDDDDAVIPGTGRAFGVGYLLPTRPSVSVGQHS